MRFATGVLFALLLVVASAATGSSQTTACSSIADDVPVAEVGAFSNMRYTVEHAYGFTLMLWRAGECPIGLLLSSEGLAGDTPIGTLEDLKFDSKTGRLSFSAKLTMGAIVGKSATDLTPSRDLYVFEGALKGSAVTGVMTHTLENAPGSTPTRTDVVLKASKSEASSMRSARTYGEWVRQWEPILEIRGPKWK